MSFVKIVFALALLAVAVFAGTSYWLYSSLNSPHQHDKASQFIKIEKGTSPQDIIARLSQEGIVSSRIPLQIYLRFVGDASKLQAGEYQFPSPITPIQVLKELESGEQRTIKLTIPEGFTRFDIAKRLAANFSSDAAFDEKQILELMNDTSSIRDIAPEAKSLEGYMYPSTYNIPVGSKPTDVIRITVDQFRRFWKSEWTDKARSLGRSPHEIVTIASLIETESRIESERPIIAGVINNRLAKNIPLGIDQTNVYIAKMLGKWDGTINKSDLEVDSPYNTRTKIGIPPGPISSVTESSILAALNPTANDYIFYVLNVDANNGSHWFYASAAEFEKGKAKYQAWLEKERAAKRDK